MLVALSTRTDAVRVTLLPSRSNSPVWSTRKSFACPGNDRLPISSRNNVPPSAASKRPARVFDAPVNAPASAPNSSLSMRSPGNAPMFTAKNGASARLELACRTCATFSLPEPFGPVINTGTSLPATRVAISSTSCIASLS